MEYNKQLFKKTNDKKILHKVRKHWVTVSIALLGMIGATGVAKSNVHASNLNTNHQTNNSIDANNTSSIRTRLVNDASNNMPKNSVTHNGRSLNIKSAGPAWVTSIGQFNRRRLTNQTDELHDRIVAQLNQSSHNTEHLNKQISNSSASGQSESSQRLQNVSSESEIVAPTSATKVSQPNALEHDTSIPRVGGTDNNAMDNVNNAIQNINNTINNFQNTQTLISSYADDIKSASTYANAQITRYANINPSSVNSDSAGSDFGSTASYQSIAGDNSLAAIADYSRIKLDYNNMPSAGFVTDSIMANVDKDQAQSLAYRITDEAGAEQNEDSIANLENQVNYRYNQSRDLLDSLSASVLDAQNQADKITQTFSTVSSAADSAGRALNSGNGTVALAYGGTVTNTSYPIANVDNSYELINAIDDPNVHQINITKGISTWDVYDGSGDTSYEEIAAARNLTLNGLNNDGSYNSVDWVNYNFNMTNAVPHEIKVLQENMNIYGMNYWGPGISANNGSTTAIEEYHNINFVGAQLTYARGVSSVLFTGKDNICDGQAYSPTGMYTHPSYKLPGNVSLYPGIIKNGIDTTTGKPVTLCNDTYEGPTRYASNGTLLIKHGTRVNGYFNRGDNVPDIVIDSSNRAINAFNYAPNSILGHDGIDIPCDQQIVQITGGNQVRFGTDSHVDAMTTNADAFTIDSTAGTNGNSIRLNPGAQVRITPNGNSGEGPALETGIMPSAIHLEGSGEIDIDPGATLKITPSDETLPYCKDSPENDQTGLFNSQKYMPAAINLNNGGKLNVYNGGTLSVQYPKSYNYNLPGDLTKDYYTASSNTINPLGAISLGGTSSINAYPYSKFLINAGGPTKNDATGNLVALGPGNSASNVNAMDHSTVELNAGGNQKIMLFSAPSGTPIKVNDPKQFSLDLTRNTSRGVNGSALASPGVSIEGDQVTAYDEPGQYKNSSDYDKFAHPFGQFNEVVLPGQQFDLPQQLINQIINTINDIEPKLKNYDSTIWPVLGKIVWGTDNGEENGTLTNGVDNLGSGYPAIMPTLESDQGTNRNNGNYSKSTLDLLNLIDQAHLIPWGTSNLENKDNQARLNEFNDSIDLPYIIADSMMNFVEHGFHLIPGQQDKNLGKDPKAFGKMIAEEVNSQNNEPSYYDPDQDHNMIYDSLKIPMHKHGFDISRGFAFRQVPQAYLDGVHYNAKTNTISGYAYPGSYISVQKAQDASDSIRGPITTTNLSNSTLINDTNYDPDDPNKGQYVTTASDDSPEAEDHGANKAVGIGYWSYKLPSGFTSDQVNNLVVVAHTATVGNKNAGRDAIQYIDGRNITSGRSTNSVSANQPNTQPSGTTDYAPAGSGYHAYLTSNHTGDQTLTVTGDFSNYGGNGLDNNNNNAFSRVDTLNLGNASNIRNANKMFKNMPNLYTINTIGDWNTNQMTSAEGMFDGDNRMDPTYLGQSISSWGNSQLTDNNFGNTDGQFNGLIPTQNTGTPVTDKVDFIYNGQNINSTSINGNKGNIVNIDNNSLPNGYTVTNNNSVILNGNSTHYINVVKVGSPIYTGDSVQNAEIYYQNIGNFPSGTYPEVTPTDPTGQDPSGNKNDPTQTDNDYAGHLNNDGNNTDENTQVNYYRDASGDNSRFPDLSDDRYSGQYFEAGRLKGDLDKENMDTDNSIYNMPYPFIIGYLTAKFNKLNRQDLDDDINKALQIVEGDYNDVFNDYLPDIRTDGSMADKDLADIKKTANTLYSLVNYSDQSSANPFSYYPYSNLQSLANTIGSEAMAASGYEYSEYSYNSEAHNGSNNNDQVMYNQVYGIDQLLDEAIQTLLGYKVDVNKDADQYNNYYNAASTAAQNNDKTTKETDLLKASIISDEAGVYDGSAFSIASSANSEDSSASVDNNSASSDSNSVKSFVSPVRTSTSNSEASDFDSVAQSYAASASYDTGVIRRDLREVRHRYHQLDSAGLHSDHVFASDSAEINKLSSEVNSEIKHDNLSSGNSLNDATSASSALNSASSALNMASAKYSSAMSSFASSGYTSEISAMNNINLLRFGSSSSSDDLDSELSQVNIEDSVQSADIKAGDFDAASDVNIGFNSSNDTYNTSSNITDPNIPSTYSDGETSDKALTYQHPGVFYNLLDKARDTEARNDMRNAALAQAKVRSLAYSAGGVGAVEQAVPMLVHSIMLGASPDASHGVVPNRNGNDANHDGKAQNNSSIQTSNIKVVSVKKDANGNVIDSESQDFPVKRPIGSDYVVDPQDYAPAGYHAVNDQIVNDPMTPNGLDKKQIVFNYQTNDSNSNDMSHTSQGIVNINYVNSTNNEVVHTEPIHGNLGKPFNLSQYDGHLPSGYRFNSVTDGMNINKFMNQPQNVTVKVTPISSQPSSASHNVPKTPARPQSSSAGNDYVPSYPQSSSNNSTMNNLPNASSSNQTSYSQPNSDANNSAVNEARSAASDGQVNFWDNSNSADNNSLIPQSNSTDNSASNSTNGNSAAKSSASSSNSSSQKSANAGSMNNDSTDVNNSANNDDSDGNDNTNNDSSDSHVNRTGNGSKSSIGNNDGSSVTRPSHSYVNGVKDALSSDPAKRDSSGYMKGYMDQKRYNDSDSQNLPQTGEVDYAKLAVALLLIASATGLDGLIDRRHSKE